MTHEEDKNPDEVDAVDAEIVDSDLPERIDPPLTPFQKQAATFLAANGYTQGVRSPRNLIHRTAILVGYGRATIHRWLRSPAFLHLIESIQARGDAASSDGWDLLMRGAPEHGIAPNFAACIAWKKHRNPEQFDEAFIRQERKLQHEREMAEIKHRQEVELLERRHQQSKELLELKAKLGMPPIDELPEPDFSFRETGPGERIAPEDLN